jgi:DNA-binding NtrC family response regulator
MRVLLLEHDPLCAFDYLSALEANGHDVIGPAARVSEARRLLRRRRIGLALIDIHLGLESGLDLLPFASEADVPCIAVTGYPLAAKEAEEQLLGCMPKPVSGEQIAELVDWISDVRAGYAAPSPSTLMLFRPVPPAPPAQRRRLEQRRLARPVHMPKRLRRSLT